MIPRRESFTPGASVELPPQSQVRLSCGHTGAVWGRARLGVWVSCWAVVINGGGKMRNACQCQRKIVAVQESL